MKQRSQARLCIPNARWLKEVLALITKGSDLLEEFGETLGVDDSESSWASGGYKMESTTTHCGRI